MPGGVFFRTGTGFSSEDLLGSFVPLLLDFAVPVASLNRGHRLTFLGRIILELTGRRLIL